MENYHQLSDEQLVELSQQKDDSALSLLTERYINVSKYISSGFSLENSDNADLTQEGMIAFLGAVRSFKETYGTSFNTYASRCIRNRMVSLIRSIHCQSIIPTEFIVSLETQLNARDDGLTPEESTISQLSAEHIMDIIESDLTARERKILLLYLAGHSYDEISKKAGITVKAVDSALQRGRKKIKNKLRDEA